MASIAELSRLERQLLDLLEQDARLPVVKLALKLGVSRATVQQKIQKLERDGFIEKYTLRLGPAAFRGLIRAHLMIRVASGASDQVVEELRSRPEVHRIYSISGEYDLIAFVTVPTTDDLLQIIDFARQFPGVTKTQTSVILATRYRS